MAIADFSLSTSVAGGIHQVNIQLTDSVHKNKASVACRKTASACQP
ncbi:hypothetical protein SK854_42260 [Lentzea sp. BCCO 10_0061]|uniref:Uncharacterized protein n=1 Tax=Lentzea sokolovensis TaxID=3095429 RepID=A0ABU4VCU6_9PSEU|nr:hypothetical protein [Lentzea sp. BCCO 10_0061]MDX8148801.1 hypothetical protein [Lentzea sp. BCCO 10_0061]